MAAKPDLSFESEYSGIVAGVDEAGCAPLAGPVVAAAVILDRMRIPKGINDSKKLPLATREYLYDAIMESAHCSIGIATVTEIDTLNILGAAKLAMTRAVAMLMPAPDICLIDGNRPPILACKVKAIVGGDGLSLSIAAASIIAKVTRDRLMKELATECPGYGWETNVGYPTATHRRALIKLGVTPHHRRGFAPVRQMLEGKATV